MKIVVFTKNWLGDVIFETPAIRAIKENFPKSYLIAITPRRCAEILEANPYVDEVIKFGEKSDEKNIFSQFKLIRRLRKLGVDRGYLFHRSTTRARLLSWGGVREIIGYDTKGRGRFLTHAVPEPPGPIHNVEYFLKLIAASGLEIKNDFHYDFYFTPDDLKKAEDLLARHKLDPNRLVAVNAGANWPPKRWPPSHFRELSHLLAERFGIQIVLTGSTEDKIVADEILNHGNGTPIVSLCGKTTVRQLGALFSKCRLVISNDTGPLHVAAGVGANVIGIFGPTASRETAPLGRGKNIIVHYYPKDVQLPWNNKKLTFPWMELISVNEIFETIQKEKLLS